MIQTKPVYVDGDNLGIGQYFGNVFKGYQFFYSSIWRWFIKTSIVWGAVSLAIGLLIVAMILPQEISEEIVAWGLLFGMIPMPLCVFLPFVWIMTYYSSFIAASRFSRKIKKFIETNIPEATDISKNTPTDFSFSRKNITFETAYPVVPPVTDGKPNRLSKKYFVIAIYYYQLLNPIINSIDPHILNRIMNEWYKYNCDNYDCRDIHIDEYSIYVKYRQNSIPSPEIIGNTLDNIQKMIEHLAGIVDSIINNPNDKPDNLLSVFKIPNMN